MILVIPFLVAAGIAAGPVLAKVKSPGARRTLGWTILLFSVLAAHFSLLDCGPVLRMIGICCVLLGGMKGLVYAEWAGPEKLSMTRYAMFSLLWFGMDPGNFCKRRAGLSWKVDMCFGAMLTLIGVVASWFVWRMNWRNLWAMFLPMSLAFHFGALRVLKGCVRAAGFPVRTLFPNPLKTRGIGDFWSLRWNVGYSQMMQRVVGRPITIVSGRSAGIMAVFVASGLLHELAITLPVRAGFGGPTLYFLFYGLLALMERKRGKAFGRIPTLLAVALPIGCLFPPAFRGEVIARCLEIFKWLPPISG